MRAKIIKVTSFISLTLIPGIFFYWDYWGKLKTEQMNIFEYYSENLHTLLFMSAIGLIIATLTILYWNLIDFTKKTNNRIINIEKALYDHTLRIKLYEGFLFRISINQLDKLTHNAIGGLTDEEKKYLGIYSKKYKEGEKIDLSKLTKILGSENPKIWNLLKDEYNGKNKFI